MAEAPRAEQDRVRIFDTTLRDGEQSPGISLNKAEKLEIAQQLARLGVDIIEAGFPIASPGDFDAVQEIAREVHGPVIAGLARANAAGHRRGLERRQGLRAAAHPHVHLHERHPHRASAACRPARTSRARRAPPWPRRAATATTSSSRPMDATRSDLEFTAEVLQIALDEGATTINVPDTVGYSMPREHAAMWEELYRLVPGLRDVVTSVHCHDDLGLAVANSFAGLEVGLPPGRVRDQRHRRARGQRVARGDRDADRRPRGRSTGCGRASRPRRSPARAAWSRA